MHKHIGVAITGFVLLLLQLGAESRQPHARSAPQFPIDQPAPSRSFGQAGGAPLIALISTHQPSPRPAPGARSAMDDQTALVRQYCVTCHNDRSKAGGLSLAEFDAARLLEHAPIAEKMIRKLRAGMMPPSGARRPDEPTILALVESFESRLDQAAAERPNPGWRPSPRLSRAEYARAVRDLLAIDVEVAAFLPADTISDGFDNIADTQRLSPTLLQGYLRAASEISRLAVGDRNASPSSRTWKVPRTASQMRHVEGAPLGTRGGLSVVHVFPADGEYVFKAMLHMDPTGDLYGAPRAATVGEQLEISLNGQRAVLMTVNPRMNEQESSGLTMTSPPIHVTAGPHRVSAAFLSHFDSPVDDLIAPVEHTLADTNIGSAFGVTALPHVRDFTITGPLRVTGVSETPSRRRIFTCRPTAPAEEAQCAGAIIRQLSTRAYRSAVSAEDFQDLMTFYERGRRAGDFEDGIRFALQAILASPRFLIRPEGMSTASTDGESHQLSDSALASRLSFFLWGTIPDAELRAAAERGELRTPAVLEKQVKRMLADARSEALASRFASQWLRLQDVDKVRPDHHFYPHWDTTLSAAMVRETELFFHSLIREDRSVLDLLTADYTFVNERLGQHYGLANVLGTRFRRVQLVDEGRRGILGHGSVLLLTSVADRTSPVLRGKWVMEVLLGSPPPPPPPNVPMLEETAAVVGSKVRTVRERMEEHRANPACTSCHRVIDPLGLALENFDATGAWRINDNGTRIDPVGDLFDGTRIEGPAGLRSVLLNRQDVVILSFTESLMTYALGRRMEFYDMPAVRAIVRRARADEYRLSTFILGVVRSAPFRTSTVPEPHETAASGHAAAGGQGTAVRRDGPATTGNHR